MSMKITSLKRKLFSYEAWVMLWRTIWAMMIPNTLNKRSSEKIIQRGVMRNLVNMVKGQRGPF